MKESYDFMKKNIEKDAVKPEELAILISNTMERNLTKVQEVLDLDIDDLIDIIERLSDEDRDKVIGTIINNQLEKLKTSLTMKKYRDISRDVDEITDYYTSKKDSFDSVIEEGDTVANEILFKVIGNNKRSITLPIDISVLREYCFSSELKEEQFNDTLMWIALRYIAIQRCLVWKDIDSECE